MSMADLIQWGRTSKRTGLLTFTDERGKEIRVVLSDGRWEGLRRAEIWNRMNAYIHQNSFFESNDDAFDLSVKCEDVLVAGHVFARIDVNISVAELTERLPFGPSRSIAGSPSSCRSD